MKQIYLIEKNFIRWARMNLTIFLVRIRRAWAGLEANALAVDVIVY